MQEKSKITIIFPEQLFDNPQFSKKCLIFLIEDPLIFGDKQYPLNTHFSKRVFHRATMKAYEDYLTSNGYDVTYIEWQEGLAFTDLIPTKNITEIRCYDFSDFAREKRLHSFSQKNGIAINLITSPYFLNTKEENTSLLGDTKPRMQNFYTHQRKKLGIFIDENDLPIGGKWSFDEENRKKIPLKELATIPQDISPIENDYTHEARAYIQKKFPTAIGSGNIYVPITHTDTKIWLNDFLDERFENFGKYEDAMVEGQSQLYHSILSPLMNCGLLTPKFVIDAVMDRYSKSTNKKDLLPSTEGFVRQIIGWREYMRAIYDLHGVTLRNSNEWVHEKNLPTAFYSGTTGIPPLDDIIGRLLETGYSHHIERLMLLGNMMFLLRVHPRHVYTWFSEMYLDAYDWVMVGNVYGMSQCSKIDFITTKPYICGSNYIKKMSNYTNGKKESDLEWCVIWDALYWQFLIDNEATLRKNHRWKMMYSHVDRFDEKKKAGYMKIVSDFEKGLHI